MAKKDRNELLFIFALAVPVVALSLFRHAYNISAHYGYGLWSYETWSQLRWYLLLTVVVLILGLLRYKYK